jgi:F-type H+-transporting ATPase subunit delta
MKISKEAKRIARQLIRHTVRDGRVNEEAARQIVGRILAEKPRHYLGILSGYQRMLRLEVQKRHAIVENATSLSNEQCDEIRNRLRSIHGNDVTAEFRHNPELIGGMRVKLGSTVWDGSLKARLDQLSNALLA